MRPYLLHVVPVLNDARLDGVAQIEDTLLLESLMAKVLTLVLRVYDDSIPVAFGSSNQRWKEY